jgi:hypothetical protein
MTQNAIRNDARALRPLPVEGVESLVWWIEQYFQHAVTTSPAWPQSVEATGPVNDRSMEWLRCARDHAQRGERDGENTS